MNSHEDEQGIPYGRAGDPALGITYGLTAGEDTPAWPCANCGAVEDTPADEKCEKCRGFPLIDEGDFCPGCTTCVSNWDCNADPSSLTAGEEPAAPACEHKDTEFVNKETAEVRCRTCGLHGFRSDVTGEIFWCSMMLDGDGPQAAVDATNRREADRAPASVGGVADIFDELRRRLGGARPTETAPEASGARLAGEVAAMRNLCAAADLYRLREITAHQLDAAIDEWNETKKEGAL